MYPSLVLSAALNGADALDSFLKVTAQPMLKLSEGAIVVALALHMALGLRVLAIEFIPMRERTRVAAGREPTPSAVCIDSQSVKTTEMGGPERGYDGGKKINGRKRHLLVATRGLLLAVLMTSAGLDAGVAAPLLLGRVHPYH